MSQTVVEPEQTALWPELVAESTGGVMGSAEETTLPDDRGGSGSPTGRVGSLRGAGVDVNGRRVAQVVLGLCLAALAITTAVLFAAGFNKNSQINELQHNGVPVQVTVARCYGLLGGSGSNLAGYS